MLAGGKVTAAWAIAALLALNVSILVTGSAAPMKTTAGSPPADTDSEAAASLAASNEPAAGTPSTTAAPTAKERPKAPTATTSAPPAPAHPVTTTTTFPFEGSSTFPFEAEVTPPCAERGDEVTLTMKTRPNSATTAAVAFSNNQAYGNYTIGTANAEGAWVWRFTVPEAAPYGQATVLMSAADRRPGPDGEPSTNGEYVNTRRYFEVKKSC